MADKPPRDMDAHGPQLRAREDGNIILGVLITIILVLGLIFASTSISTSEITTSRRSLNEIKAYYVAQAGVERGINFLKGAIRRTAVRDPMMGILNLFAGGAGLRPAQPFVGEPVVDGAFTAGEFTVTLTPRAIPDGLEVTITATGYTPWAPHNRPKGGTYPVHRAVEVTVSIVDRPSEGFDHAMFVDNWGYINNNNLVVNGSVRSNGQLNGGGGTPHIDGQPRYESADYTGARPTLSGYKDDNGDGLSDGNDGGLYSSWDITGAGAITGPGGLGANQHDFESAVNPPLLADLTRYEAQAIASTGTIEIGGTPVSDHIFGDDASESGNLFLMGTPAAPVHVEGTVVVRGDVVIVGTVTGQGAIYTEGNIYVPGSLLYQSAPSAPRPASNSQPDTEAWLDANRHNDIIGLFAKGNISVGNHQDSNWRSSIEGHMADPNNSSAEDHGEDRIPNTVAGRDGLVGTVDDDLLEGDTEFTVEIYSAADLAMGLIPPGKAVGDPIPGSGEDIDGDGVFDGNRIYAELEFGTPLSSADWGGNIDDAWISTTGSVPSTPQPPFPYNSLATNTVHRLDGVLFTNQALSIYSDAAALTVNGALLCRHPQLYYAGTMTVNYDARLLGGGGVMADNLPHTVNNIRILSWQVLDHDPNHDVAAPIK